MTYEKDGETLYYERTGAGRRVLLLHGWGGKCESFLPVYRDFAQGYDMIRVDFPGHGRSSEPPKPWSVTEYAALIADFMIDTGIAPADIVAHSFGGRVALLLAATRPELVGKMVLTGCAGLLPKRTTRQKVRGFVYKCLRAGADNAFSRGLLGAKRVEGMRSALQERFGSADYKALSPAMRMTFSKVVNQDLFPYLKDIHASTLLFWGEADTATPLWMAHTLEKEIPDAGLVVIPGAGHFAYLDGYDRFKAVLENFLPPRKGGQ